MNDEVDAVEKCTDLTPTLFPGTILCAYCHAQIFCLIYSHFVRVHVECVYVHSQAVLQFRFTMYSSNSRKPANTNQFQWLLTSKCIQLNLVITVKIAQQYLPSRLNGIPQIVRCSNYSIPVILNVYIVIALKYSNDF